MRRSLYLRDDDYRLSFLYGNFTTLTRFTEMDLERVVGERLSPLFVSIHSTNPELRASLLRNQRGAMSLRWLRALLDAGIEVHGQIVVCPGVNDGPALEETMAGILDAYPELASVACVPLGISRWSASPSLRAHSVEEAGFVVDMVHEWQEIFQGAIGRRMVHASDEYYLMSGIPFPPVSSYEGFPQHENGVGMATAFSSAFGGTEADAVDVRRGYFASVDGAPPSGYRSERLGKGGDPPTGSSTAARHDTSRSGPPPILVLTGEYGARVIEPLITEACAGSITVRAVHNDFFGGNIAVTGLLTGTDVSRALRDVPESTRVLLPDVCLSNGMFLDGTGLAELDRPVEVVQSDGASLRRALEPR